MIKIALTGEMRSGKTTVASYIEDTFYAKRFAFGDALKSITHQLFDIDSASKPRKLYQDVGQALRSVDEDVWINLLRVDILKNTSKKDFGIIVIDDLRQPNEYEWAKANGYIIIRVEADNALRKERAALEGDDFSEEDMLHDTESHAAGFDVDYTIINSGSTDALYRQVLSVIASIVLLNSED